MKAKFEIGDTVRVKSKYSESIDESEYEITSVIPNENSFFYELKLDNANYGLYAEEQLIEVM